MATKASTAAPVEEPVVNPEVPVEGVPMEPPMPVEPIVLKDVLVKWPAKKKTSFGRPLESFELKVPVTLAGRLDVYSIPKCADYPEGYFFTLGNNSYYQSVEPGCLAWEKFLLLSVQLTAAPTESDAPGGQGSQQNVVIFQHQDLDLSQSDLNPNDYTKYLEQQRNPGILPNGKPLPEGMVPPPAEEAPIDVEFKEVK